MTSIEPENIHDAIISQTKKVDKKTDQKTYRLRIVVKRNTFQNPALSKCLNRYLFHILCNVYTRNNIPVMTNIDCDYTPALTTE